MLINISPLTVEIGKHSFEPGDVAQSTPVEVTQGIPLALDHGHNYDIVTSNNSH